MADEVRVTDPDTGGEKGRKAERYSLIPAGPLAEVARLYGAGAEKYDAHNWRRGYAWSLSADALHRHLAAFESGYFYDDETGCHHLASVVFHALALMEFTVTHPAKDDVTPDGVSPYPATEVHRTLGEQETEALEDYATLVDLEAEAADEVPPVSEWREAVAKISEAWRVAKLSEAWRDDEAAEGVVEVDLTGPAESFRAAFAEPAVLDMAFGQHEDRLERARFVAEQSGAVVPTGDVDDLQGRRVLIYDTPGKGDALNGLGTITSGPAYHHAADDDYLVAVLADSGEYPYYYLLSTLQLLEEGDADA